MAQVVVYLTQDGFVNGPDSVIGNGSTVPTIAATKNIALTYDVAVVSMAGLQEAVRCFEQWIEQNCNGSEALGSTYAPATNAD